MGALAFWLWARFRPENHKQLGFAVASGLLAGEGLMAIITAVLKISGVNSLVPCWGC
jgi:uncharacterized oligopeptide transporter (OPT) family protein